jgi:hypothetical protein
MSLLRGTAKVAPPATDLLIARGSEIIFTRVVIWSKILERFLADFCRQSRLKKYERLRGASESLTIN